jgi:hypothetical protein
LRDITIGKLKLFPNPASDYIRVELPENQNTPFLLEVYDSSGRLVSSTPSFQPGRQLHIATLANGLYTLLGHTSDGVFRERLVVSY